MKSFDAAYNTTRPGDVVRSLQRAIKHVEESLNNNDVYTGAINEYIDYYSKYIKEVKGNL